MLVENNNVNQISTEIPQVLESKGTKFIHGFHVQLRLQDRFCREHNVKDGWQHYRNVTNFRYKDESVPGLAGRLICNSDIHQTGIGWDVKDVFAYIVYVETETQPEF